MLLLQFFPHLVDGGHEDQHHLRVAVQHVVPDHENGRAQLASQRDSVLRIQLLVVVRLGGLFDEVPIDHARLDRCTKVDQEKTIGKVFVLEVSDLDALVSLLLICPLDHFLVRLVVNQLQVVDPHKLPH